MVEDFEILSRDPIEISRRSIFDTPAVPAVGVSILRNFLLAPLCHGPLLVSSHGLDEFHTSKSQGRPVFVNRHHPDAFEASGAKSRPASIAIELAFVFL